MAMPIIGNILINRLPNFHCMEIVYNTAIWNKPNKILRSECIYIL